MEITRAESGGQRRLALRRWFASDQRDFSWRRTRDPWQTLVAETLLRRTKAAQVEHRIGEVLAKYPRPQVMAEAPREQVRQDLRSFGLRWRADNLADTSRVITDTLGGNVPTRVDVLMTLPGVGPYVAAATSATVSDSEVSLIDTNTVRVATRVAGVWAKGDIRRRAEVIAAVDDLLGGTAPAKDWWAVLDLAALICTVRDPRCHQCPLRPSCAFGRASEALSSGSPA